MNLFDTFRFTVNDGVTDTQVFPITSGLRRSWQREGDTRSYRMKLNTKMVFRKADYAFFRAIYDLGDCLEVSLLIENYCGGAWVTWFEGIIPIFQGEYNKSMCEVSFDVSPNDVYECANKSFGVKKNWLDILPSSSSIPVKTIVGTIEIKVCKDTVGTITTELPDVPQFYKGCWGSGYTTSADPDPALAWRPISHHQDQFYVGTPTDPDLIQAITTWAREKVVSVGTPPGTGWINISGTTWVRPVSNMAVTKTYIQVRDTITLDKIDWESQVVNSAPVSNGRLLKDLLIAVVDDLGCGFDSVISNFLNINPDATNPSNAAYDYADANFQNLFFFQKSDIVRSSASNDATRFETNMKEFLEQIKIAQLFYAITNVGGVKTLRIEHYTYFDGSNGLDLTTLDGGKYIVGLDSFKSDDEVPAFESFGYQESYRPKFLTQRIDYPATCVTTEGIPRDVSLLNADFGGLVENPDAGLEGFFLLATHEIAPGEYLMNTLGGEPNGAFAWENMLPALWADGRYNLGATSTIATTYVVNSVRKSKAQPLIRAKFCCSDEFEPSQLVKSQLGWGEVKTAEQDTELGRISLTLLH